MDPKFTIDGRDYDVPELSTFDMDEWEILYDKTGLTLDTIEDAPMSPGLLRAMLIVAYRRGNPGVKAKQIEAIVGRINFLDAMVALSAGDEEEADDGPPALAASSPPLNETLSPSTSDPSSATGSETPAVALRPIGTLQSATPDTYSRAASGS